MSEQAYTSDQPTKWNAYGVRIAETWFVEPAAVPPVAGVDVIVHNFFPSARAHTTAAQTILIDLNIDPDDALAQMKQDMRYKIRRAENKDGVAFEAFGPAGLAERPELLAEFLAYFDAFAREKGLNTLNRRHIECQAAAGILWLTRAVKDDAVLVWHAYIVDNGRARLRNSASHFRGKDSATRNMIGRVNRWVHWKGMSAFREAGVAVYDLGGWYGGDTDVDKLQINRFKEGFGGETVKEYSCSVPVTLKGRAFLIARRARDLLQSVRARTVKPPGSSMPQPKDAPTS